MGAMEAKSGNGGAWDAALLAHVKLLYGVAYRFTGDREAAERLTEDTLRTAMEEGCESDSDHGIKTRLLALLRKAFVRDYGPSNGMHLHFQM